MTEDPTTTPSKSQDLWTTVWKFNCGHSLTQKSSPVPTHLGLFKFPAPFKQFNDQCPECRLKAQEIQKAQQQAWKDLEEEVAGFEEDIKEAEIANNTELKAKLEKAIDCREILWARQIFEVEKQAALDNGVSNHNKPTLTDEIKMKLNKLEVLIEAEGHVVEDMSPGGLDHRQSELKVVLGRLKDVQEQCGSEEFKKVHLSEEELEAVRKQAIKLLMTLSPEDQMKKGNSERLRNLFS